jgi:hypothetical protein
MRKFVFLKRLAIFRTKVFEYVKEIHFSVAAAAAVVLVVAVVVVFVAVVVAVSKRYSVLYHVSVLFSWLGYALLWANNHYSRQCICFNFVKTFLGRRHILAI